MSKTPSFAHAKGGRGHNVWWEGDESILSLWIFWHDNQIAPLQPRANCVTEGMVVQAGVGEACGEGGAVEVDLAGSSSRL